MSGPRRRNHGTDSSSARVLPAGRTSSGVFCRALVPVLLLAGSGLHADPLAPGFTVSVYAQVTDPQKLAFDANDVLYVGRDNAGSGGGNADAVFIHRIGVGGSPVQPFGSQAIPDPDAVFVDRVGWFGPAGAVLVGGAFSGTQGHVARVDPDQSQSILFGPSTGYWNPSGLVVDSGGRFLFTNYDNRPAGTPKGVYSSASPFSQPVLLFTMDQYPAAIAVDQDDRMFVSTADGRIRKYAADGTVIDPLFVQGLGPGAFAASLVFGAVAGGGGIPGHGQLER